MGEKMKHILLIFGGTSSEHEVSLKSAKSIYENIDKEEFDISMVYISKDNTWHKFDGNFDRALNGTWLEENEDTDIFNIIKYLTYFDVVFPILHGINGEDGRLQGLLELFNIPYVGCPLFASAIGIDKVYSKILFKNANIPVLPSVSIDKNNYMIEDVVYKLDFPMIVKPSNGGSSIGINVANSVSELDDMIKEAGKYDNKILIEPFIQGQELECAILEKDEIIASTVGEIIPANDFYDYNAKYENKESITLIPANIPSEIEKQIQEYAKKAFRILGCKDLARVDFFYDKNTKKIYLNEINTLPGFTTISMYPKLLESDGISYKELLTALIRNSLH